MLEYYVPAGTWYNTLVGSGALQVECYVATINTVVVLVHEIAQ